MIYPAEKPAALRNWQGHEWNCPQCSLGYSRGFCEHGEQLKAESDAVLELLNFRRTRVENVPRRTFYRKNEIKPFDPTKYILPETPGQQEFLARMLTGSQAKTAFALRMNAEKLCKDGGINSIGFLTLTVGEYHCPFHGQQHPKERNCCPRCEREMNFVQVYDAAEASRRINNLNRRILPVIFERAICVTERMKSGAIHFHLLGILSGRPDIRTGLNFEAIKKRDYHSAPEHLRELWAQLREILPRYGFGRAELLPVKKTGEAVSSYISKYIEKNVANRLKEDARKKLVRYIGWKKQQLKPNEFEWNGENAKAWRAKTREILNLVFCELPDKIISAETRLMEFCRQSANKIRPKQLDGSMAKQMLGARWAFQINRLRASFDQTHSTPFLIWDWPTRETIKGQLFRLAPGWCRRKEAEKLKFTDEIREIRRLISCRQFAENFCGLLAGVPAKN
jgi:hypothetical protein